MKKYISLSFFIFLLIENLILGWIIEKNFSNLVLENRYITFLILIIIFLLIIKLTNETDSIKENRLESPDLYCVKLKWSNGEDSSNLDHNNISNPSN